MFFPLVGVYLPLERVRERLFSWESSGLGDSCCLHSRAGGRMKQGEVEDKKAEFVAHIIEVPQDSMLDWEEGVELEVV